MVLKDVGGFQGFNLVHIVKKLKKMKDSKNWSSKLGHGCSAKEANRSLCDLLAYTIGGCDHHHHTEGVGEKVCSVLVESQTTGVFWLYWLRTRQKNKSRRLLF